MNKRIHIIAGGTINKFSPHAAISSPAYGKTGRILEKLCKERFEHLDVHLHLTKMANSGNGTLETNEDVSNLIDRLISEESTKIIFMPVALADYSVELSNETKNGDKLNSKQVPDVKFILAPKLISKIRKTRKDIYLVGFKATSGLSEKEQYWAGLSLLKGSSCNLVLANDNKSRVNMIVTPEEATYHVSNDREATLKELVDIVWHRSHLTFTQSSILTGDPVDWNSAEIPSSLREVVNYCIKRGVYKPFNGATAGHFAAKISNNTFLTSIRKTNFNDLPRLGLVKVVTDGPDAVLAYGAKPSVGGQSQRIVFNDHPGMDCIVHFHCPKKLGSKVNTVQQRTYECGSHACGKNTSDNLDTYGNLKCIYLDQHGPNIVFNHTINPKEVIDFIEQNFDLDLKTGGPVY